MNRADAYAVLSAKLAQLRALGFEALLDLLGQRVSSEVVRVGSEDVVIDVRVMWQDRQRRSLRVEASAYGPSTWSIQRLEEKIIVRSERRAVS